MIPTPSPRHLKHNRQFRLLARGIFVHARRPVPAHKLERFVALHNEASSGSQIHLTEHNRRTIEASLINAWKEWY
jgi:hypothetical protein